MLCKLLDVSNFLAPYRHNYLIKLQIKVERDNLKGDAVELTRKLEDEHSLRNDLEDELQRLRKGKSCTLLP